MRKIVIAGGTGFIGTYLSNRFLESGYDVYIVSRSKNHIPWIEKELTDTFEGAELVINLAGKSINCPHNDKNRKAIINSRIFTTKMIGNAIANCKIPPKLWINASATGVYKPSFQQANTEDETELGTDFLAEVVTKWEKTFFNFHLPNTRQIALRTSVVLGKNGGALKPLLRLGRCGLGGKQGSGNQIFSWIHVEDYFQILLFVLKNNSIEGVLNCTAPEPVSNKEFMRNLREVLHISFGVPAPKFAIEIGAKLIGVEPGLILNSSFVIPKRLANSGFKFTFPYINAALKDLLN
jgi:uncharacterized protein